MRSGEKRSAVLPGFLLAVGLVLAPVTARPHGDVNPQPVKTEGLEALGETWRATNPYRDNQRAIEIGKSAYNQ